MDPGRRMDGLDSPVSKIEPSLSPSGEPDEAPEEVAWVHQVAFGLTEQACRGGTYLKTDLKSVTQGMAGKHKTL